MNVIISINGDLPAALQDAGPLGSYRVRDGELVHG